MAGKGSGSKGKAPRVSRARLVELVKAGDVAAAGAAVAANPKLLARTVGDVGGARVLHFAALAGHMEMVTELLGAGAAVDATVEKGWTLLWLAASKGHKEVVEVLLGAGAAVDATDEEGWTPLWLAASKGHKEVVEVLLGAGAAVNAAYKNRSTPLLWAACYGHKEMVEVLLGAGAAVDAADKRGWTPLRWAASNGHKEMVEVLLGARAVLDSASEDGTTPLSSAASIGHKEVVEVLVRAGAAFNMVDKRGWTPLWWAASNGQEEVVEVLLGTGAAADAADKDGWTLLRLAASVGHEDVVELLLRAGVAVDAVDEDGHTALSWAASNGHNEVAEVLLSAGASVDGVEAGCKSPLEVAASLQKEEVVRVLVAWGAHVPPRLLRGGVRSLVSGGQKLLRDVLEKTPRMTAAKIDDARAKWRAAAVKTDDQVAVVDAAGQARAELRVLHDGFVSAPETLTLEAIKEQLLPTLVRDLRCLQLAHRVLLFADRVGVFAGETAAATSARRVDLFERVYQPMVSLLSPVDRGLVAAIVRHAAEVGLVEQVHRSVMGVGLELDKKFSTKLQAVLARLDVLEEAVTNGGELLLSAVQELRDLKDHLRDKEAHDRKVALAKSAVKIGMSLAPIVGGVLNAGVDAVASFADGAGAAVVCRYLADPTDIAAARQILQSVGAVRNSLTDVQLRPLLTAMLPYASLEELDMDLASADVCLCVDASAEEASALAGTREVGALDGSEEAAGVDDAEARAADEASDQWEKPKEAITDVIGDHAVDKMVRMKRGAAEPGRVEHALPPLSAPAGVRGGVSRSADAAGSAPAGRAPPRHQQTAASADVVALTPLSEEVPPARSSSEAVADGEVACNVPPPSGAVAPAPEEVVGATQTSSGAGTGRFGADFFADVAGWSSAVLASKLVEYAGYAPPLRDEFDGVVRANAEQQVIDGGCVMRCEQPDEVISSLLGEWRRRVGPKVTVQCFIKDARKHAPPL